MGRGTCHGGRPSFPPPPVLGRSTLGAVDMPIGCALTFFVLKQGQSAQQFDMLVRRSGSRKPASIGEITS
jgi:hypothetical protein